MVILPLKEIDLPFLLEVRNHPDTRCNLENDSIYSYEQCLEWFKNLNNTWYILWDEHRVGYIREDNDNLIGCDIHIDYRRKGYATKALRWSMDQKHYAQLWVFSDNFAYDLYKKLGFKKTGDKKMVRGRDYIHLEWKKY